MKGEQRTYLHCPFHEKEEAKSLGARWDGTQKQWWIPHELDPTPFARWLHPQDVPESLELQVFEAEPFVQEGLSIHESKAPYWAEQPTGLASGDTQKGWALSSFLLQVQQILSGQFSQAVWIRAELASLKETRGNWYLELIETNEAGQRLASTRAMIWKVDAGRILSTFERATGGPLQAGMAVLLRASVSFHIQYSFSLTITEIDASYTQGRAQQQLLALRNQLKAAGVYGKNKAHPLPSEFTHVCVIAPAAAAGLGDFRAEADWLSAHGLCRFSYLDALFQGERTAQSLTEAITKALSLFARDPFDALCILRGGGSVLDLNFLNHPQIAFAAADLPCVLLTGLGHEQDSTLLDELATKAFDTPSKLALHIEKTIFNNASQAIENMRFIRTHAQKTLAHRQALLGQMRLQVHHAARAQISTTGRRAHDALHTVNSQAQRAVINTQKQLTHQLNSVMSLGQSHIRQTHATLAAQREHIQQTARFQLKSQRMSLEHCYAPLGQQAKGRIDKLRGSMRQNWLQVMNRDPTQILQQGYALARTLDGQVIHTRQQAYEAQNFHLMLADKRTLTVTALGPSPSPPGDAHDSTKPKL